MRFFKRTSSTQNKSPEDDTNRNSHGQKTGKGFYSVFSSSTRTSATFPSEEEISSESSMVSSSGLNARSINTVETTRESVTNAAEDNNVSSDNNKSKNYGHEAPQNDSTMMYGYREATRDEKNGCYGYEDAAGPSKLSPEYKKVSSKYESGEGSQDEKSKYGYGGDAALDSESNNYGYGDAAPDSESNKYGYEDAAPDSDSKYGCGDTAPDERSKYGYDEPTPATTPHRSSRTRGSGRRSSMKQTGRTRRASIQFGAEVEVYIPDGTEEGKRVTRRTSISFNGTAHVRRVAPAKELTDEPEKLWFQEADYKVMRQKVHAIVDTVESGTDLGGKKLCVRGLERYIGSSKEIVSGRRDKAWDSVLDEQNLQRCKGEFDEDHIANAYKYSTMDTQHEANQRAVQDAVEAELYTRKARRAHRRMSSPYMM
jgi:Arc/MetJ family transcription regulator